MGEAFYVPNNDDPDERLLQYARTLRCWGKLPKIYIDLLAIHPDDPDEAEIDLTGRRPVIRRYVSPKAGQQGRTA